MTVGKCEFCAEFAPADLYFNRCLTYNIDTFLYEYLLLTRMSNASPSMHALQYKSAGENSVKN